MFSEISFAHGDSWLRTILEPERVRAQTESHILFANLKIVESYLAQFLEPEVEFNPQQVESELLYTACFAHIKNEARFDIPDYMHMVIDNTLKFLNAVATHPSQGTDCVAAGLDALTPTERDNVFYVFAGLLDLQLAGYTIPFVEALLVEGIAREVPWAQALEVQKDFFSFDLEQRTSLTDRLKQLKPSPRLTTLVYLYGLYASDYGMEFNGGSTSENSQVPLYADGLALNKYADPLADIYTAYVTSNFLDKNPIQPETRAHFDEITQTLKNYSMMGHPVAMAFYLQHMFNVYWLMSLKLAQPDMQETLEEIMPYTYFVLNALTPGFGHASFAAFGIQAAIVQGTVERVQTLFERFFLPALQHESSYVWVRLISLLVNGHISPALLLRNVDRWPAYFKTAVIEALGHSDFTRDEEVLMQGVWHAIYSMISRQFDPDAKAYHIRQSQITGRDPVQIGQTYSNAHTQFICTYYGHYLTRASFFPNTGLSASIPTLSDTGDINAFWPTISTLLLNGQYETCCHYLDDLLRQAAGRFKAAALWALIVDCVLPMIKVEPALYEHAPARMRRLIEALNTMSDAVDHHYVLYCYETDEANISSFAHLKFAPDAEKNTYLLLQDFEQDVVFKDMSETLVMQLKDAQFTQAFFEYFGEKLLSLQNDILMATLSPATRACLKEAVGRSGVRYLQHQNLPLEYLREAVSHALSESKVYVKGLPGVRLFKERANRLPMDDAHTQAHEAQREQMIFTLIDFLDRPAGHNFFINMLVEYIHTYADQQEAHGLNATTPIADLLAVYERLELPLPPLSLPPTGYFGSF